MSLMVELPISCTAAGQKTIFAVGCHAHVQGRTQEGADGAKALPQIPRKNYLLIQIRSILCFVVRTKKSVSQSFYDNRLYRLRC